MVRMHHSTRPALATALLGGMLGLSACGAISFGLAGAAHTSAAPATSSAPASSATTSTTPGASATVPAPATTTPGASGRTPRTTPTPPTATPKPKPTPKKEGDTLQPGDSGAYVATVQQRLSDLGYWNGSADGTFGGLTSQAVMALQKAAGLGRDGVFGPATQRALKAGIRPQSRIGGTGTEIDKARQLLLIVRGGQVVTILNTSTGSGNHYTYLGQDRVALTPAGTYSVYRTVDHLDKGPLGDLWRPRYFNGGIAVHGSAAVPGYPASHGCSRVSDAAMNMIWANNLMPVGSRVVVY
jgi:peptidoglycan hydrolase-like protein with peptidoglycan-binding domain